MTNKLTAERNMGIEALRVLAMLMICTLHVLGQGGVLASAVVGSAQYNISWLLESAAFCGVNCYALISGYVGVRAEFRWSRLALIWLQVLSYELVISTYFQIVVPSVMISSFWVDALTPVTSDEYWFITAYFGMFLFIPLMNAGLRKLSKHTMAQLLGGMLLLLVVLPAFNETGYFGLNLGYSVLWLSVLYILGGYIRQYAPEPDKKRLWLLPVYALGALAVWLSQIYGDGRLLSYCSPAVLLEAAALLLFFRGVNIKGKMVCRIITFIAPTTLGVYLIHTQPRIFDIYLKDAFAGLTAMNAGVMTLCVLAAAFTIFVACSLVDAVRIKIFELLKINAAVRRLDSLLIDKHTSGGVK